MQKDMRERVETRAQPRARKGSLSLFLILTLARMTVLFGFDRVASALAIF